MEFIAIDDLHEGRPAMERLLALHQKRWGDRGGSDAFVGEIKLPFHRETAEAFFQQGTARLFFLKADGETVAALYGFILGRRFFYYQAGFDPAWKGKSVGMVLMAKCIEAAISQGWSEFDFLRGPEEYKSHWTSDRRQTQHWILSPPGMKNNLYRFLAASLQTGRRLARRLPSGRLGGSVEGEPGYRCRRQVSRKTIRKRNRNEWNEVQTEQRISLLREWIRGFPWSPDFPLPPTVEIGRGGDRLL
ncbi:MAG: GNAT family N-acetyltransferase [Candidatus Manganitrophus sp.]|nr:GNAT family N-acetyltransferase [Candidatus Manganitrophus sp.]